MANEFINPFIFGNPSMMPMMSAPPTLENASLGSGQFKSKSTEEVEKENQQLLDRVQYESELPGINARAAIEQNRANINPNVQQFLPREAPATVAPQFPGQTLSQFMRYEDTPQAVTMQALDPQGRLRQFTQGGELTPQLSAFEQASADREARLAQEEFLRAAQRTGSKAAIDAAQASVFDIPQQQVPTAGAVANLLYATEQAGIKGESRQKLFDTLGVSIPGEAPKPITLDVKPPKEPREAVAEVVQDTVTTAEAPVQGISIGETILLDREGKKRSVPNDQVDEAIASGYTRVS